MIKQLSGKETVYKLPLSDGTTWGFCATESIFPWLKMLAEIMQLKKAENEKIDRKILFIALNKKNVLPSDIKDWRRYKQGSVYRIWSGKNSSETFVELNKDYLDHPEIKIINMWSTLKAIFRYYVDTNIGPAHAASAVFKGKGILIAASGGTGKSTCMRRLPDNWTPLSDDTTLIVRNKKKEINIHPMPTWSDHLWSDKFSTFPVQKAVPLKAIFFLKQSSSDKVTEIHNTSATQEINKCFNQIWQSYIEKLTTEEKNTMIRKLFNTAYDIAGEIPCYSLEATLNGKFWEEIEKIF